MTDTAKQPAAESAEPKTETKTPASMEATPKYDRNKLLEKLKGRRTASDSDDEGEVAPKPEKAAKAPPKAEKEASADEAPKTKVAEKVEAAKDKIEDLGGEAPKQKKGESDSQYAVRLAKALNDLRDAQGETLKAKKEAKTEKDAHELTKGELAKFKKIFEDGKANPLAVLEAVGSSLEDLIKGVREDRYKKIEKAATLPPELLAKIEKLEKAEKDREAAALQAQGEAQRKADEKAVAAYLDEHADDFPFASAWKKAARTIVAKCYELEATDFSGVLKELELGLADDALDLVKKDRSVKALLKKDPELKKLLRELSKDAEDTVKATKGDEDTALGSVSDIESDAAPAKKRTEKDDYSDDRKAALKKLRERRRRSDED